jgi:AcrR family transcriptional regulator
MIHSAALLFAQRGVAGTAMADILEHSEAPRGSVYHYFPDGKEQLAQEATLLAGRREAEQLTEAFATEGIVGAIASFIDRFREGLAATEFAQGCPIAAAAQAGEHTPAARDSAGDVFSSWEKILATALWRQGVPLARAENLACYVLSAIEGAVLLAKAQHSTRPLDRVGLELTDHLRPLLTPAR